jgi:GNAT superfamily N-acetyltransferase
MNLTIESVDSGTLLDSVRRLFREYQVSLGIDLGFQGFEEELAGLPGAYQPPRGRLYLALVGTDPAGCIALRPFSERQCEMKRLYVRSEFRGRSLGEKLARTVIRDARLIGYAEMLLDTLPTMVAAQNLYRSLGFRECPAYRHNPVPGSRFMKLDLAPHDPGGMRPERVGDR